jgi:uncharacterized protein (DUF58 family)
MRVTPLGLSLLVVSAWALALGVISARPELFVAALPLMLVVAALAARPAAPEYTLSHEISADRVFEGETLTVTVTVTATSAVPLLILCEHLPGDVHVARGRSRAVMALAPGETARLAYDVRCPLRGVHDLGTVAVQARDRLGVRAWERRHVDGKRVRVYPRIVPMRSLPRPRRTQTSIGDYVSRALGEGIEPGDVRPFAPGDRIKQVNWRASLRLGTLYVTQRHQEQNADVVLMLDTLAQVGAPPDTTLDLGVRATASLATAYLARKDRVGLITYGGTIDWIKPASGRVQYERLAGALLRASVVFTFVMKDLLALVPARVLPPHALVIAVTPLLDPRFTRAVLDLAARGYDLVVLVVSPVEVTRAMRAGSLLDDLACRLWTLERRAHLDELGRHGLAVLEWNPAQPLELALVASA